MQRSLVFRLTALAVAANYLWVLTASVWFHDHGGKPCGAEGAVDCLVGFEMAHEASGCGARHGTRSDVEPVVRGTLGQSITDGDDCPVCRFLGQKPIPARCSPLPAGAFLQDGLEPARPLHLCLGARCLTDIRGPPLFG